MARVSALESFLQSQLEHAEKDSSGNFTIMGQASLEKMAAFQFENPMAWVGKVLQAIIACGARELRISQYTTDIQFDWVVAEFLKVEEVAEALFDSGVSRNRCLDHLKRALWQICLHHKCPVLLCASSWDKALFWNGKKLHYRSTIPRAAVSLTVSYRNVGADGKISALSSGETARMTADIFSELCERACTYSIPITVDGRRLDALQLCSNYGFSEHRLPLHLDFLATDLPELKIPQASFAHFSSEATSDKHATQFLQPVVKPDEPVALASLVTACLTQVYQGGRLTWQADDYYSSLFWVLDGIVVEREKFPWPEGGLAFAVFASAEGLVTDLSGFKVIHNQAYSARFLKILEHFKCYIENLQISLRPEKSGTESTSLAVDLISSGDGIREKDTGLAASILFKPLTGPGGVLDVFLSLFGSLGATARAYASADSVPFAKDQEQLEKALRDHLQVTRERVARQLLHLSSDQ